MSDVFDGLADIFAGTFGEAVIYTPKATGIPLPEIMAIWIDHPLEIQLEQASLDACRTELSLRASDIPTPREGDTVLRVKDGAAMRLTTPIQPDGKGMIVCNLERP